MGLPPAQKKGGRRPFSSVICSPLFVRHLGEQAVDALSPLRALRLDLPNASLDLLYDTGARLESQFRRLADDCTAWR